MIRFFFLSYLSDPPLDLTTKFLETVWCPWTRQPLLKHITKWFGLCNSKSQSTNSYHALVEAQTHKKKKLRFKVQGQV